MSYNIRKIIPKEVKKLEVLYVDKEDTNFTKNREDKINLHDIDIYVIEDKNQIIGEVTIIYNDKHQNFTIKGKRVYMEALRVLKNYQGLGIGQKLLNTVLELLKQQGIKEVTIGVEKDNEIAKHIYQKLGFTEYISHEPGEKYAPNGYDVFLKRL